MNAQPYVGHVFYTLNGSWNGTEEKVNGRTERTKELEGEEVHHHVVLL